MIAVPGYDYVDPPDVVAQKARMIVSADPKYLKSASAHGVLHEGSPIAAIILVQVQPQYAGLPVLQQSLVPAMAKEMAGSGARVSWKTIHTQKVAVAKSEFETDYVWYHNGVIAMVGGENSPDVRDYVDAYLQTAHATGALQ